MFHKRNPQGGFPGGQSQTGSTEAFYAQTPQTQTMPQGTSVYSARAMAPASDTAKPQDATLQTTTAPKEGPKAMNNPAENTNAPTANRPMDIPGTMPYGRPMTPGMGYANTAAYNPYGSGRKLIIGQGITMSGEIEHCDHLIVEGTVQATLKDAKMLDISEAGVFYGTVDIEEATIAGRFEGDITVAGRLTVKASGTITGSIKYKELAIEAGATIDGTLTPTARRAEEAVATADFSKGKAAARQQQGGKQDQQLFGENKNATAAE